MLHAADVHRDIPVPPVHHSQANSPDREDLLPGLCVLGQRWVADVALGSFRGSQVRLGCGLWLLVAVGFVLLSCRRQRLCAWLQC